MRRVAQAADGAVVTCAGGAEARARRVISTLPVNAIAGIEWEPGLPGVWQRANAETVASQGVKVWVKARGRVPRFVAYASQRHPISVLKTEFTDDDATVLVGFGPDHTQLDVTSVAGVQAAVDALRPGLEVIEVAAHDWMKDPLSRTTWMTHRPGQLTRDLAGRLMAHCQRSATCSASGAPGRAPSNGTVGYQNCLNALAGSVACRVTAWLIVVSSWSVRSSRLLART